jgi:alpha-ribazole phosphatase
MIEVYVIRHTAVAVEPGICYGQTDVAVAGTFADEAENVRQKLPVLRDCPVYSSPLCRCLALADMLTTDSIITDDRLMEMHFGEWEHCRWDDLQDEEFTEWTTDFVQYRCPGGESYQDVFTRVSDCWNDLLASELSTMMIVTHGGVIRTLLSLWLNIPLENTMRIAIDFGGVTKVRQTAYGPVVEYVNR